MNKAEFKILCGKFCSYNSKGLAKIYTFDPVLKTVGALLVLVSAIFCLEVLNDFFPWRCFKRDGQECFIG